MLNPRPLLACFLALGGASLAVLSFADSGGSALRQLAIRSPAVANGDFFHSLFGVTCLAANDCWAIGYYEDSNFSSQRLVKHWNGGFWAEVPTPSLPGNQYNLLNDIACIATANCWAVGYDGHELIEHWDGSSWSLVSPPAGSTPGNNLAGVTCLSPTECWAVGTRAVNNVSQTLTERWDGAMWSIVPSPNTSATVHNVLARVACVSSTDCWAVGHTGFEQKTLTQHWDGTAWSIIPSGFSQPTPHFFRDVVCTSAAQCWAVGQFHDGNGYTPLFQRWDGNSWSFIDSPRLENSSLNGITCSSPSNCWAVGYTQDGDTALVEHWDGTSWSLFPPPPARGLNDINCVSGSDCWAVDERAQAEHWDGAAWTVVTTPPRPERIVSRKMHGSAGAFEIELPYIGAPGIECRTGATDRAYELVLTFADAVALTGSPQAQVISGVGEIGNGGMVVVTGTTVTVPLLNVADAQKIQVRLNSVTDGIQTGDLGIPMNVLIGDTNGNKTVNASDVGQTKAQSGAAVTAANFRTDVNASGTVTASDIGQVKANAGHALP